MQQITLTTAVVGGKCTNRTKLKKAILSFEGCTIEIQIKRWRSKRSNEQNRYYWGVIVPFFQQIISENYGERISKDDIHSFLKQRFNPIELVSKTTGEIISLPKSTTLNNTQEQECFHEQCRAFALEFFGEQIPLPNEQLSFSF